MPQEVSTQEVNCFFRGGPFDGSMSKMRRDLLDKTKTYMINGNSPYRLVDGPILAAFMQGTECENLSVTLQYSEA